jgi:hypothetical protein
MFCTNFCLVLLRESRNLRRTFKKLLNFKMHNQSAIDYTEEMESIY